MPANPGDTGCSGRTLSERPPPTWLVALALDDAVPPRAQRTDDGRRRLHLLYGRTPACLLFTETNFASIVLISPPVILALFLQRIAGIAARARMP